jgi:DNA-binding LytR/AlgR family response regulator
MKADAATVDARALETDPERASPYRFIPVRWQRRFVIVPLASISRIDACNNHVTIVAERSYLHRETLEALCNRLPPETFVRVHRSHVVNRTAVRELAPGAHGEYRLMFRDGSTLTSGRTYRDVVQRAFWL